jgi:hypothetical protein
MEERTAALVLAAVATRDICDNGFKNARVGNKTRRS